MEFYLNNTESGYFIIEFFGKVDFLGYINLLADEVIKAIEFVWAFWLYRAVFMKAIYTKPYFLMGFCLYQVHYSIIYHCSLVW